MHPSELSIALFIFGLAYAVIITERIQRRSAVSARL